MRKVPHVTSEEITQAQKLSYLVYIGGGWSVLDRLQFVHAGQNTLFGQAESKVGHFFTAKEALLQVYLDVVLDQTL